MAMHDLNLASRFSTKIAMLKNGVICAAGEPGDILNPETIRDVYGVETSVHTDAGYPFIIPLSPVGENRSRSAKAEVTR
jgi:iron complex transport system ATP-binding protein